MIRSELLQALARENPDLRADEVEQVLDTFFDEIGKRLAEGGRVELRGFGAFSTRERARASPETSRAARPGPSRSGARSAFRRAPRRSPCTAGVEQTP